MRFAGNSTNVGSYIQAGKAGAKGAADAFKVARQNAPDYGGLGEAHQNARAAEREAAIKAEAHVAQAGINAMENLQSTKLDVDAKKKVLDIKLNAQRMAGIVGAVGTVAGGAFLGMENNRAAAKQRERDARKDAQDDARMELLQQWNNRPEPDDSGPELEEVPTYTPREYKPGESPKSSGDTEGDTKGGTKSNYTGGDDLTPQNAYLYLTQTEGLSPSKAKGLIANMQRESSFDLKALGDNGTSVGLFQWHAERADGLKANVPDYGTNWKGQLSYALNEDDKPSGGGAAYRAFDDGGDEQKSADWWLRKWERSAHQDRDQLRNNEFLKTYNF